MQPTVTTCLLASRQLFGIFCTGKAILTPGGEPTPKQAADAGVACKADHGFSTPQGDIDRRSKITDALFEAALPTVKDAAFNDLAVADQASPETEVCAEMLSSPRRSARTMRIFASAE